VDLEQALENIDCSRDQWLEWGDAVEIPERVHPLNTGWASLSGSEVATLTNCAARMVRISVSGTNFAVRLQPLIRWPGLSSSPPQYTFAFLPIMLRNERQVNRHLRSSSDLARVTVRRVDPETKEVRAMTFDASEGKVPFVHNLWLRGGDVIEIPEKQ